MSQAQSSWLEYFMKYKDSDGLSMQKRDCDWCRKSFYHSTHIHCSYKCWNEALENRLKSNRIGGTWLTEKLYCLVLLIVFMWLFLVCRNCFHLGCCPLLGELLVLLLPSYVFFFSLVYFLIMENQNVKKIVQIHSEPSFTP